MIENKILINDIGSKGYINLYDVMCMNLNQKAKAELANKKYKTMKKVMPLVGDYIDSARRESGRLYDYTKRDNMKAVIEILYTYLIESEKGQVSPSLFTLAHILEPSLEYDLPTDNEAERKRKKKAFHKIEMRVQRALKDLEAVGLIQCVKYHKDEEHVKSYKNPCHFYVITPLSTFFPETFSLKDKKVVARKRPMRRKFLKKPEVTDRKKYVKVEPTTEQQDLLVVDVLREMKFEEIKQKAYERWERINPSAYYEHVKREKAISSINKAMREMVENKIRQKKADLFRHVTQCMLQKKQGSLAL